ncbi:alpha-ketoglutarate-dependent dioxygenase AlkB [Pedobacter sp. KACC 23697]|uniref:Alpha-ketoglutarate-dependent dioxygenase AlkB n=1 Tax=Pedobacter sp. KACC 23697 TaxID=3149230 RepID=A0AAU7K8P0_9SPHI
MENIHLNCPIKSSPYFKTKETKSLKVIRSEVISGLTYYPDFISEDDENELLAMINAEEWLVELKRRVQHYGWKYNYRERSIDKSMCLGPLPHWVKKIAISLKECGIADEIPDQVIVNEYRPGQGISNHIDCEPCFADTIISISLSSTSIMNFINLESKLKIDAILEARSAICLKGDARYKWSHGIPGRLADDIFGVRINRGLRISMTFRKVII